MSKFKQQRPQKKTSAAPLTFCIEHLDGLAQGVDKRQGKITFIAKTLPEETGIATVYQQKKGVQFARMQAVTHAAKNRITPECRHFNECSGCDYLHTDYASELKYKQAALDRALQRLQKPLPELQVSAAPQRLHYRNRVQLHYRGNALGFLDATNNKIVAVPQCQLIEPALRETFNALYNKKIPIDKKQNGGHCELALVDEQVQLHWNKPYAFGGFTQVNQAMNTALQMAVLQQFEKTKSRSIVDLFSGQGNLSNAIIERLAVRRKMADICTFEHADFLSLDLFSPQALTEFMAHHADFSVDTLLVDPPRAGFAHLSLWVQALKPRYLLYVSCNAPTMVRDISNLACDYHVEHVQLLDMFPASKHFETFLLVKLTT